MPTRPRSPYGFTLLELLVVVAIMGLLLAMLLPSLSSAHELGRKAVCGTQLNQLFHGSFNYSQDNDERIPYYAWMSGRPDNEEWWVTQIARGMDHFEPEIYRCPSDTKPLTNIQVYHYNGLAYMADRGWPSSTPHNVRTRLRRIRLKVTYRGSCDMVESVPKSWRVGRRGTSYPVGTQMQGRRITAWARPHMAIELVEGIAKDTPTPSSQRECFRFIGDLAALASGKTHKKVSTFRSDLFAFTRVHANYDTWERHFGSTNVQFIDGHVDSHQPPEIGHMAKHQEHRL